MKKILIFVLCTIAFAGAFAQTDSQTMVAYSSDYKFQDGIFLNFEQVKANDPIPKSRIVTSLDPDKYGFFQELLAQREISLYDGLGQLVNIKISSIWGFADKGFLYINYEDEFNRIPIVGSISHFVANKTVFRDQNMYSPLRSNYYYYGSPYQNNQVASKEMAQFILDFSTGKISDYSTESVEIALMRCPELYDQFEQLSSSKQEKKRFFYIRQFNEKMPLMLPVR
jgi:hypothetical protein